LSSDRRKKLGHSNRQQRHLTRCRASGLPVAGCPKSRCEKSAACTDHHLPRQHTLGWHPIYTRPASFHGWEVPQVLLSGDPVKIQQWQEKESLSRTERLRPDLLTDLSRIKAYLLAWQPAWCFSTKIHASWDLHLRERV